MPSQQVEIAETISNLKRALSREKGAPSNRPIYSTTNRGNKLQKGASLVNTGNLAYTQGGPPAKQKIEHAGYTRYILEQNPRRYNEYGDELADSESDEGADAQAADGNPYRDIRLEELLCPLRYPSELANHPTLSNPYVDTALSDMVKTTEDRLRQERANLWRAKNLNRQLLGDEAWMPCERVESREDWEMFEPRTQRVNGSSRKKRKIEAGEPSDVVENGTSTQENVSLVEATDPSVDAVSLPNGHGEADHLAVLDVYEPRSEQPAKNVTGSMEEYNEQLSNDVVMDDAQLEPQANGATVENHTQDLKEEEATTNRTDNGQKQADVNPADVMNEDKPDEQEDTSSLAPPTRRITRALAANNDNSNLPTPALSPTPTLSTSSTSSLLQIDPLFLVPNNLRTATRTAASYKLPLEEASETRRLLTAFIQKQEESVRGYEALLSKLIRAQRMRDQVWEVCKADGHVGEMSDGEDWIDYEQWNLQPGELRKGRYEEEDAVEETGIGGRKGKRRRNQ